MSGANGYYNIHDVTTNSFKLTGKAGDCNFIYNDNANTGLQVVVVKVMTKIVMYHLLVVVEVEPMELLM